MTCLMTGEVAILTTTILETEDGCGMMKTLMKRRLEVSSHIYLPCPLLNIYLLTALKWEAWSSSQYFYFCLSFQTDGLDEMTSCERLRDSLAGRSLKGAYIPACTAGGDFEKTQCWSSTGVCWCVDAAGAEIDDTRRSLPKRPDCDNCKWKLTFYISLLL